MPLTFGSQLILGQGTEGPRARTEAVHLQSGVSHLPHPHTPHPPPALRGADLQTLQLNVGTILLGT